ncbi:MAG TPA: acyltransferase, partial [Novosphingobium sp.]|nr:acyltransferase [Novosphingobium sp.]
MTQRAHFEVLDGLRGVAAVLVLGFHLSEIVSGGNPARNIFPHGALAVDFFFALSGFVIAHAYDARMAQGLGFGGFLLRRVVRLHPLVPLATAIGALAWLFGPDQGAVPHMAGPGFALAIALALFVLPYPTLAGRWDDTHSLDGPTWTLLQEYVGSIAYGLVLWRVPLRWLGWLLVPAGVALIAGGLAHGTIASGFGWSNWEMAPTRLAFPFIAGIA